LLIFFERKLTLLFLVCAIPLLFLPKINIVGFSSETAGIRIDDLVLLLAGGLVILARLLPEKRLSEIEVSVLVLTLVSLISFISNRILVSEKILILNAKIYYAIRLFEYFIFFYIGSFAARYMSVPKVIRLFLLWNLLWMLLQKFDLIGGITVGGYNAVSERVQGVASFPSEMGLILDLLFCYLIFAPEGDQKWALLFPSYLRPLVKKSYLYVLFCVFGVFVIFTGNRISILALLVCFLCKLKDRINFRSLTSMIVIPTILAALVGGSIYVMMQTESVYARSMSLFSVKNFELAAIVWDKLDLNIDPLEDEVVSSKNYDASWWMRIHKWIYILKTYVTNPECYLQGLGPGTAWSALDGGFLRIFVEYGVIGSLVFGWFFYLLYKINRQTKWMMIAFFFNLIFFDAYLAYKAMSFLLFSIGSLYQLEMERREEQRLILKQTY